jgi:hypothetical protein
MQLTCYLVYSLDNCVGKLCIETGLKKQKKRRKKKKTEIIDGLMKTSPLQNI